MKALLLAGGAITEDDPLSRFAEFGSKSMIPIHGKPMVQWVLDALNNSKNVERIYITGLNSSCGLSSTKPITYLPDQASLFGNIKSGSAFIREDAGQDEMILLVSGDIPGLTTEMVEWLVQQVSGQTVDIIYSVVPRKVMEGTFPLSKRSYIKFKDVEICGGDINVINTAVLEKANKLWQQITDARKNSMKQAGLIGYDTLFLLLIRALTLDQTAKRICRKMKITGKALQVPFAEMGMDVDKPHQLDLVTQQLAERNA